MFAHVYLRRCRGKRLSRRDEMAQTPLFGEMTFATVGYRHGQFRELILQAIGNTTESGQLAVLYEPVMIGLGTGWISFRGFDAIDTGDGSVGFVQEWRCRMKTSVQE